jgi:hypothetical protein
MPSIKLGTEKSAEIEIHYNDHGAGKPIVLIHGYPLDGNSWERQERVLLANGCRCEKLIADLPVVEIAAGPHNVGWTPPDEVSSALLSFFGSEAGDRSGAMATAGQM